MAKKEEKIKKTTKKKVEDKKVKKTAPKKVVKKSEKVVKPAKKIVKKAEKPAKKAPKVNTEDILNTPVSEKDKVLLTEDGLQKLKDELKYLEETKRDEVAQRLQEAISYGDLSENAEYEEAKNEQAFCEGRIAELKKMIKNVQIIDEKTAHKTALIRIGTTVVIQNLTKNEDPEEYTIVGSTEADPFSARISNESPIGKTLLGKKKGETIQVSAPGGEYEFLIVKIK